MPDRQGDELVGALVRDRGKVLLSYAYLLTGDVAAAQDLVQDAFVKVFTRARTGFAPDIAEAYVRTTILTLYIDGFRRRRRWASIQHLFHQDDHADGPESTAVDRVDLHTALGGLTRQERTCVVLRFYGDLTIPEVAAEMRVASGTVKRYLHNAVRKLEKDLGPMPSLRGDDRTVVAVTTTPSPTKTARS